MFPYTLTHKHTLTTESPQCARCFVLVLVCVEPGDTATRVSSLRVRGVGVIGPDHKETSSLQPIWEQWTSLTSQSQSLQWASVLVQWTTIIKICFTVPPNKNGLFMLHKPLFSNFTHLTLSTFRQTTSYNASNTWQTDFTAHPTFSFPQVSIRTKTKAFFSRESPEKTCLVY